ncbi:glutaredoxin-like protein, YruB-family [Thermoanaerobacterium xylanolyticum LX-11]|uniref:Glutaredoxin-like protein, YruB-family n=1 Tax=Thermoanaerobacterium xylanolyticum (strain ATCC 49914 / DSM 7097 / LX-11) TaxID=858215 RepID=F6BLW2_THEXL|nr:glutaredoxin domain-containing protein [Thermoanaerobacterium xylanolyticum]AEF18313.1 glutaredoxin-like protein, YruB-family [Thermoanaerobacterium xylanolyticum LX-11]
MLSFIKDRSEFEDIKKSADFFMLLFYSNKSQKSLEALDNLKKFSDKNKDVKVYAVNASEVGLHTEFGITAVPALIAYGDGKVQQIVYGVQSEDYYEKLLTTSPVKSSDGSKKYHRVIVYTSPSCPWCSATKSYLRQNNIPFREVDVTKNPGAAEELVRRSGQRGVPQTDIDGTIVVGFDKARLNTLLGIQG